MSDKFTHFEDKFLPTLYIVPTPIGNLEDMTLRGLRVLREVSLIAAEDTRTTRNLLQYYQISTPLTSYHEHNKLSKLDTIFNALAAGDVALVSDAGTPGISDPGFELIQAAIQQGFRVEPLPGANALLPALIGSGLSTNSFIYAGFLPRKSSALRDFLQAFVQEQRTLIVYESPNRLCESLTMLLQVLGDRPVCVARELSKKFEEFQRGLCSQVLAHYLEHPPRGEVTLVVAGVPEKENLIWDEDRVRAALDALLEDGQSLNSAARAVAAAAGWNKRDVYAIGTNREK